MIVGQIDDLIPPEEKEIDKLSNQGQTGQFCVEISLRKEMLEKGDKPVWAAHRRRFWRLLNSSF